MKNSIFSLPNNREETDLDSVLRNMQLPVTRIGLGDSGAHLTSIMDGGFFPFLLVHYCRDRVAGAQLGLEAAVKMLSADNADLYHLSDRGVLAEGMSLSVSLCLSLSLSTIYLIAVCWLKVCLSLSLCVSLCLSLPSI